MNRALTSEEVRTLDAKYQPFSPFASWTTEAQAVDSWESDRARLEELRETSDDNAMREAVRAALQAAASDTGAIEGLYAHDRGFTISVATLAAAWDSELAKKPDDVQAILEAQLEAYELALDAATRGTPIGEAFIRRIHEVICAPQETYDVYVELAGKLVLQKQPLPKGEYKRHPNHVRLRDGSFHVYAPVDQTHPEMARFMGEISSVGFDNAHPVLQAAYAHHALTAIHPFADGNGRVARVLSSVFLLRAASVPLVVFYEQMDAYFDALAAADGGRPQLFLRFVAERSQHTMRLGTDQLRASPESHVARLAQLLQVPGGLAYEELTQLADSLIDEFSEEFTRQMRGISLPRGVVGTVQIHNSGPSYAVKGYAPVVSAKGQTRSLYVVATASAPSASAYGQLHVFLGNPDGDEPLLVEFNITGRRQQMRHQLPVAIQEVHPIRTNAWKLRTQTWVRAEIGDVLEGLTQRVADILGKAST